MATRKRLKKQVYIVLGIIVIIFIVSIVGINKYQEYKYHQTYEYKFLEQGYNANEVKILLNNIEEEKKLIFLLKEEKNSKIINILEEKYYLDKNFYNYIDYMQNNTELDAKEIVRNININLNYDFYETKLNTDTSVDTSMLVNKYYTLSNDYEPDDLVNVSQNYAWGDIGSQKVREVAYNAFLDMWNAAHDSGYYLMINSSYRSYADQEAVYENYKKISGESGADKIAARPGSSEHQTGLAIDIFSKTNTNKNTFADTEEAKWLANNAYKYGFILRYPEDKVDITGYSYEAWHYRYVGVDIATYIYKNDITFEEYYAYYIEK